MMLFIAFASPFFCGLSINDTNVVIDA